MSDKKSFIPISFNKSEIDGGFWASRIEINRSVTIPIEFKQCKDTGRIDAFKLDWKLGHEPVPHIFWDSDVAKWIEAASYSLVTHPDPDLDSLLDEVIALISSAQQPDGYLNTHFSSVEPDKRWTNLRDCHELYCAGHMIEAAVAHFQATGKRSLLDVLCRYADYINEVFGIGENQIHGYCGHEEIELALVKLYRVTGKREYLELSIYFIEERGKKPYYFDIEAVNRGELPSIHQHGSYSYMQADKPVRTLDSVEGHSVRAMYLYSAMMDLSIELSDESLFVTCERLWNHLHSKHLYITGGIGSSAKNEGFTNDYNLPNETAYCETCASIGLVYWNHRMLQKRCDRRYSDVIERALYNNILSSISLNGDRFFYANPLSAFAGTDPYDCDSHKINPSTFYQRKEWFGCACCPPNLARLLASLGEYIYSESDDALAVHLYVQGEAKMHINGTDMAITQQTQYPWDGVILLKLAMEQSIDFTLRLRIPSWCTKYKVIINGKECNSQGTVEFGYFSIRSNWKPGDEISLNLDMPVMRVYSHPDVRENIGCVALQRGPIVYCIEQADNSVPVRRIVLQKNTEIISEFNHDLLNGVVTLHGNALSAQVNGWEGILYSNEQPVYDHYNFTAIPYYAWANRKPGEMRVWIPELGEQVLDSLKSD